MGASGGAPTAGGGSGVAAGVVGGSSPASAVPLMTPGGSRRPSRIPQPSRLPQPLRHHPGADPDGPNKMSGTTRLGFFNFSFLLAQ